MYCIVGMYCEPGEKFSAPNFKKQLQQMLGDDPRVTRDVHKVYNLLSNWRNQTTISRKKPRAEDDFYSLSSSRSSSSASSSSSSLTSRSTSSSSPTETDAQDGLILIHDPLDTRVEDSIDDSSL